MLRELQNIIIAILVLIYIFLICDKNFISQQMR